MWVEEKHCGTVLSVKHAVPGMREEHDVLDQECGVYSISYVSRALGIAMDTVSEGHLGILMVTVPSS